MKFWQNILIGAAAAAFFSLFYAAGLFAPMEERIYDMVLRFRPGRERIGNVVFLDVDDAAIAWNGVFPWPRSVTADGLLRLKEYGAMGAIFDIEFIDRGPQGVDTVYLEQGLPADFTASFSALSGYVSDLFGAVRSGRMSAEAADYLAGELQGLISEERDSLLARAREVARDNDEYLVRASALFGESWVTLNLRSQPLDGEQAQRRPMAEELFSYPVLAHPGAHPGGFADVLPPLPAFARSARGAGFTNAPIDGDGVRRRMFLAQRVGEYWYLQLAFAPLAHWLGDPEIELFPRKLLLKNARVPGSGEPARDIVIPLDSRGMMLLDWPETDYFETFSHVSFARFSQLEETEGLLNQYARALAGASLPYFAQYDPALSPALSAVFRIEANLEPIREAKARALAEQSDAAFADYVRLREENRALLRGALDTGLAARVEVLAASLGASRPAEAAAIADEGAYIAALAGRLAAALGEYEALEGSLRELLRGRFCILGRVDTGTTDFGVNPFYGEYVNVGSHAVVLDTVLSESFIVPLPPLWSVLLSLTVPLFFLFSSSLVPTRRVALGFAAALLLAAAPVLLFRFTGIFLGPLGPFLSMFTAVVAREIVSYRSSEREKVFYRRAFATYTSEAVADEIAHNPSLLQLGGSKRRMSALFTDIRGFTSISEKLPPEDLVRLLNRYLTVMSDIILAEAGTIDKYEGDAIVAFFGAPLEQADHALRACVSAVRMKQAEVALNGAIAEMGLSPVPLNTRIGINSGSMVAGNMGTDKKMNYTIMGDAVNLAARLEGINKQYGTWILAAEDTVRETGGALLARRLDRVRVVGKSEPVRLFNVLNLASEASAEQRQLVRLFDEALGLFEARKWPEASAAFREVLSLEAGSPAALYLQRCAAFLKEPPKDDWDGVFDLTEK